MSENEIKERVEIYIKDIWRTAKRMDKEVLGGYKNNYQKKTLSHIEKWLLKYYNSLPDAPWLNVSPGYYGTEFEIIESREGKFMIINFTENGEIDISCVSPSNQDNFMWDGHIEDRIPDGLKQWINNNLDEEDKDQT